MWNLCYTKSSFFIVANLLHIIAIGLTLPEGDQNAYTTIDVSLKLKKMNERWEKTKE